MNYWLRKNGCVTGPHGEEELLARIARNTIHSMDEVSEDGVSWQRVRRTVLWRPAAVPVVKAAPMPLVKAVPVAGGLQAARTGEAEPVREARRRVSVRVSFWRLLFGGVFQRHGKGELGTFLGGARRWDGAPPRTWVWSRLFSASLVLLGALWAMFKMDGNLKLLPGMLFFAAFAVPLTVVAFLQECDVTGKVSLWKSLGVFCVGGVASLGLMAVLSETDFGAQLYAVLGASGAAPVEETAKVAVILFFLRKTEESPYVLNGILVGAAVAAGFAAFETAGYIFEWSLGGEGLLVGEGVKTAGVRAVLAPFGHVAWGAAEGGALCRARGLSGRLSGGVWSWSFLGVFAACMGLHALWNSGLAGFHELVGKLGVLAWLMVWHLLKKGYGQLESEA